MEAQRRFRCHLLSVARRRRAGKLSLRTRARPCRPASPSVLQRRSASLRMFCIGLRRALNLAESRLSCVIALCRAQFRSAWFGVAEIVVLGSVSRFVAARLCKSSRNREAPHRSASLRCAAGRRSALNMRVQRRRATCPASPCSASQLNVATSRRVARVDQRRRPVRRRPAPLRIARCR